VVGANGWWKCPAQQCRRPNPSRGPWLGRLSCPTSPAARSIVVLHVGNDPSSSLQNASIRFARDDTRKRHVAVRTDIDSAGASGIEAMAIAKQGSRDWTTVFTAKVVVGNNNEYTCGRSAAEICRTFRYVHGCYLEIIIISTPTQPVGLAGSPVRAKSKSKSFHSAMSSVPLRHLIGPSARSFSDSWKICPPQPIPRHRARPIE
jgi:hypothetical protein